MHLLEALEQLCGSDFELTRMYQQIRVVSPSGAVLGTELAAALAGERAVLLAVMGGGRGYSPALLLDLCEALIERLAVVEFG